MYSIIAVPIMSSFAVQTVQSLFERASQKLLRRKEAQEGIEDVAEDGDVVAQAGARAGREETDKNYNGDEEKRIAVPEDAKRRRIKADGNRRYHTAHTDFVAESHRRLDEKLAALRHKNVDEGDGHSELDVEKATDDALKEARVQNYESDIQMMEDRVLTEYMLELAIELEQRARRLLMGHMDENSAANLLLRADRVVQLRNIRIIAGQEVTYELEDSEGNEVTDADAVDEGGDELPLKRSAGENSSARIDADTNETKDEKPRQRAASSLKSTHTARSSSSSPDSSKLKPNHSYSPALMRKYYAEEADLVPFPADLSPQETLEEVAKYREAFASLLATGSRLLRLKDEEQYLFERRWWDAGKE
jgi:potassium channel subfamily K, other eukaryote